MSANRPEPRVGDVVWVDDKPLRITGFDEDYGTQLDNFQWVCSGEFQHIASRVWAAPSVSFKRITTADRIKAALTEILREQGYDEECVCEGCSACLATEWIESALQKVGLA